MNTTEVIQLAHTLGVELRVGDNGRLRAGPADKVTVELRQGIRQNKKALVSHILADNLTPKEQAALDRLAVADGVGRDEALEMLTSARAVPAGVRVQASRPIPTELPAPGVALTNEEVKRAMHLEDLEGIPPWESRARVLAARGDAPQESAA